jgi:[ribosomal protein S5]-alanine N-acetyltransferase
MEELTTSRLRLRPLTVNDLDSLEEIWTDPVVSEHLLTRPTRRAEVEARLHAMIEYAKRWGMWAIELNPAHKLIGRCGFYPYAGEGVLGPAEPELAFLLAHSQWGRGLATEAAGAILRDLFRSCDDSRVVALVHPQNGASRRVLDKLGMAAGPTVVVQGREALLYSLERAALDLRAKRPGAHPRTEHRS